GIETDGCTLLRAVGGAPSGPRPIFVCNEQLVSFSSGRPEVLTEASIEGLSHPAATWIQLDSELAATPIEWVDGSLWRAPPGGPLRIERWDGASARWQSLWQSTSPGGAEELS